MFETWSRFVRIHGNSEPTIEAAPMKNVWTAKPLVRCSSDSMSPTNARMGSMVMLIDASSIHNMPAATHRVGEFGRTNKASDARIAPVRK